MKKIDPKICNVPNINFSVGDPDDKRQKKWKNERLTQGFDETETWDLNITIANFILPRLEYFRDIKVAYPGRITQKEWIKILDKMIIALKLLNKDSTMSEKEYDQLKEGLDLFREWFFDLWW